MDYKSLKEDFVSNLSGGSLWEINWVTLVAPVAVLLWSTIQSRLDFSFPSILIDFLLNVGAILVAITIYSSNPITLNILLILPAIILYRPKPRISKPHTDKSTKPFITHYRGSMMVVTCLAILAVDFKIFPRRFAKVETWGTSLMDMGVGSFVFSAGLMSKKSMNLRHSIPLLVLGFIRLYSVKGLDYAEHVTEYGVHWNFFFTLALLPPSVTLLPRFSPHFMALVISCLYQATLEFTSLKVWILTASRDNLFSQNREGLFSFFGYLAIFLIGQSIGLDVLPRNRNMKRLFLWSAWFNLLLFLTRFDISRRLANLPYVLWVSAFNCSQLTLFSAIETSSTSLILGAFNRNGLVIFLLANLLTGLINLSMDTLHVNKITSMIVLSIYISILTIIATTLHVYKISIKF